MVWSTVARILKHREDSLDCCQDVFTEALRCSRRSAVRDWGAFLRWLATRRAIDHLRRRQARATVSGNVLQVEDLAASATEDVAFNELVEVVRKELGKLPDRQAEAFWLVCVEERSYEEVADQMGIQRNALGVLVHRARQHMRTRLRSLNPAAEEL